MLDIRWCVRSPLAAQRSTSATSQLRRGWPQPTTQTDQRACRARSDTADHSTSTNSFISHASRPPIERAEQCRLAARECVFLGASSMNDLRRLLDPQRDDWPHWSGRPGGGTDVDDRPAVALDRSHPRRTPRRVVSAKSVHASARSVTDQLASSSCSRDRCASIEDIDPVLRERNRPVLRLHLPRRGFGRGRARWETGDSLGANLGSGLVVGAATDGQQRHADRSGHQATPERHVDLLPENPRIRNGEATATVRDHRSDFQTCSEICGQPRVLHRLRRTRFPDRRPTGQP